MKLITPGVFDLIKIGAGQHVQGRQRRRRGRTGAVPRPRVAGAGRRSRRRSTRSTTDVDGRRTTDTGCAPQPTGNCPQGVRSRAAAVRRRSSCRSASRCWRSFTALVLGGGADLRSRAATRCWRTAASGRARSGGPSRSPRRWSGRRRTSSPGWRWRWRSRPACSTSAPRARSRSARWPAVYVGYAVTRPAVAAAPAAGARRPACLAGALWGAIPGLLKARTGAHEVIITIMLNYVALQMTSYLLSGLMKDPNPLVAVAQTPEDPASRPACRRCSPSRTASTGASSWRCRWSPSASGGCCTRARSASRSGPSAPTRSAARYAGICVSAHDRR